MEERSLNSVRMFADFKLMKVDRAGVLLGELSLLDLASLISSLRSLNSIYRRFRHRIYLNSLELVLFLEISPKLKLTVEFSEHQNNFTVL